MEANTILESESLFIIIATDLTFTIMTDFVHNYNCKIRIILDYAG